MIPESNMATISSVVATGRRMNRRDGFMDPGPSGRGRSAGGGRSVRPGFAPPGLCGGFFLVAHVAPAFSFAAALRRSWLAALFPGAGFSVFLFGALFCGLVAAALVRTARVTAFVAAFLSAPALTLARVAAVGCRLARLAIGELDLGSLAQPVGAVDDHQLSGFETGLHGRPRTLGGPELDRAQRHRVITVDYVDENPLRAALDRRRGDGSDVLHRIEQHAHVDELIGEK